MAEVRKRQPLDERALEAACEAVLAVPDHPGDKQKVKDAISTYLAATSSPSPASAPSPADGVREAELVRAATALMNNLWQDVWSYDRTHEENWKEFDRKYPGMKWLRDARDAALSNPEAKS